MAARRRWSGSSHPAGRASPARRAPRIAACVPGTRRGARRLRWGRRSPSADCGTTQATRPPSCQTCSTRRPWSVKSYGSPATHDQVGQLAPARSSRDRRRRPAAAAARPRRRLEDRGGRHPAVGHQLELAEVPAVGRDAAVGAHRDPDAGLDRRPERRAVDVDDHPRLVDDRRREVDAGVDGVEDALRRDERRHEPGAALAASARSPRRRGRSRGRSSGSRPGPRS